MEELDPESLENLPIGLDDAAYQWTDLHGEGIPGILTEQVGAWFYKRNISPVSDRPVGFAPLERVAIKPNVALASGAHSLRAQPHPKPDPRRAAKACSMPTGQPILGRLNSAVRCLSASGRTTPPAALQARAG